MLQAIAVLITIFECCNGSIYAQSLPWRCSATSAMQDSSDFDESDDESVPDLVGSDDESMDPIDAVQVPLGTHLPDFAWQLCLRGQFPKMLALIILMLAALMRTDPQQ